MYIIIYIRNLISSHNNPVRQRAIIVPILQIRKVGTIIALFCLNPENF